MSQKTTKPSGLKAIVQRWLGIDATFDNNQYGTAQVAARAESGAIVSGESALKLPTVWACTRVVSQTIGAFPVSMFERLADGTHEARPTLPIARIISQRPNADMSATMFWEGLVAQALLWGNGFAEKKFMGSRLVALELLNVERLVWRWLPGNRYEYSYVDLSGKRRVIPEENIFHLPGFAITGRFGLSAIRYGANMMGSGIAADTAASKTFENGLMPTTYFKLAGAPKKEQRDEFRESMQKVSGALNAGKSPVLENGMEVGEVGINPADAQLLESRAYTAAQVCQWFGVPPPIVGITDKASSWASSSERMNLWFLQYGLLPWIRRMEDAVWRQLLTPAQQARHFAKWKYEGLLRADTQARASFYASALQNGYMNRSTVARLEDLPPVPGGDVYTVQSNLVPLDQLGVKTDSDQLRDALDNFLNGSSDDEGDDSDET